MGHLNCWWRPLIAMHLVLDFLYLLGLVLASPWLIYRSVRSSGWRHFLARLGFVTAPSGAVWLHGSSVGEVRLIEPLVGLLEQQDLPIIISSHTPTGVSSARRAYPQHFVFRFPFDFSFIQRRLMARFKPSLIIIVESDLWPNQLLAAESYGVPVAIVNAKLSERSFRLHRWSRMVPRALRRAALVAAQTDAHADRFQGLGVPRERIAVTGNMKYDLTVSETEPSQRAGLRQQFGFAADACVVIGGSLHPQEDEDLLAAFSHSVARQQTARLVIVPRYPDQAPAVIQNVIQRGLRAVTKSELDDNPGRSVDKDEIIIVDTLGDLRPCYAAADIAFVGGSLYYRGSNKGGHNLMEPAILALPVLFGPHNFSFRETVADLVAADAGIMVRDRDELTVALGELVDSETRRVEMGRRAQQVVIDGQGASERNLELLLPILDVVRACRPNPQEAQCRHQSRTRIANE